MFRTFSERSFLLGKVFSSQLAARCLRRFVQTGRVPGDNRRSFLTFQIHLESVSLTARGRFSLARRADLKSTSRASALPEVCPSACPLSADRRLAPAVPAGLRRAHFRLQAEIHASSAARQWSVKMVAKRERGTHPRECFQRLQLVSIFYSKAN